MTTINPFLQGIPTDSGNWTQLRSFLVDVRSHLEGLIQNPDPPDTVTGLTLSAKASGIQLTWNKANRATNYVVYRAQNSTLFTSAFAIATLTRQDNVSFFDVGGQATSGQSRTYWILPMNGAVAGPISTPATTTDPGTIPINYITTTMIADNQITTPKLVATAIDGMTITGATIRTSASNPRVEMDSVNGLRAFDAGGVVRAQIAVSGGQAGNMTAFTFYGTTSTTRLSNTNDTCFFDITTTQHQFKVGSSLIALVNSTGFSGDGSQLTSLPAGQLTGSISDARLSSNVPLKNGTNTFSAVNTFTAAPVLSGVNLKVDDGKGVQNSGGTASHVYTSSGGNGLLETWINGGAQQRVDSTSSATLLPLWLMKNGVLTQLSYDGSGFVKI